MKKLTQLAMGMLFAASATVSTSAFAEGEISYNIGFASEYYFRGISQKSSSASAGVDYTNGGFYVGAWTADVGEGLEVDGYFGYGIELDNGFSASLGFTGYYYTGDFDDTYEEVNFSLGFGWLTIDAAVGEYDASPEKFDYQFYSATLAHNNFWAQYGTFQDEFEGDYLQFGYDFTAAEIDFGVSLLITDDNAVGENEEALIFSIGKTFDL